MRQTYYALVSELLRKFLRRLVVAGIFSACAGVDDAKPASVVAWGDSLTFGTGAAAGADYPSVLGQILGRTATNLGVPGETSTQVRARVSADSGGAGGVVVFWMGTNNSYFPGVILADIAESIASLRGNNRYLILPVMNRPTEYLGRAEHDLVLSTNDSLRSRYADHFVDVRQLLVDRFDASSPQDVADHAADVPPTSFRSDDVHLNAKGYGLVAHALADTIRARGW